MCRGFTRAKTSSDMTQSADSELKPTLGLVAITINAMALIAPGAFLWTTYQLQAPPDGSISPY